MGTRGLEFQCCTECNKSFKKVFTTALVLLSVRVKLKGGNIKEEGVN